MAREGPGKWGRNGGTDRVLYQGVVDIRLGPSLNTSTVMAAPRITVVDDDASVRESMSSLLRSVGHLVHEFSSGEELVASAALDQTDCVITDVRMPGMSGLELQRRLARSHPRLPVILMTAHTPDDEGRLRALRDGATDYLAKPLDEETVLRAIETVLCAK
jgi:FixJ family two-component response regulator